MRTFVYNPEVGDFAKQRRTRRLTVGSHGGLFLDFHQVLDRSPSRRSPIQGATLPVESSNTVDLLIRELPGIQLVCISHLDRQETLDGLLESFRRSPRVARALALLVITSSKVGRSGKVAAIRQLAPWTVSHLIDDNL